MADSEEEDFVALGTPFEQLEEDAPRKKPVPIHDQIVTDDRGRRRFHGAFTGGFSAGYFNTVDTKEGWAPKTFVSSRSQKACDRAVQKPEDFMDEEDLSEFGIAPKRVVTTQKFLPSKNDDSQRKRASVSGSQPGSVILGDKLLQDLIVPVKMSVGVKLLSQMGWKEGQGVGPRVRRAAKKTYGCAGPPGINEVERVEDEEDIYAVGLLFAPKDVESMDFSSKDNLHGIGYSGIDPKTALLNQRDWLGMDPGTSKIGIRGQGFGVGALEEEDEDIYGHDNLSNYDIALSTSTSKRKNDLHGWTGPQQSSGLGGILSIFCKAVKPPPARKYYPPPVIPRDFKPMHKAVEIAQDRQTLTNQPVTQGRESNKDSQNRVHLTAKERGKALGEVPLPAPKKSIFDYIADEDKTRLKESKEKAKASQGQSKQPENINKRFTSSGPLSSSGFKPFAKEPEKQARYEHYLSGNSNTDLPLQSDSKMTEWERECELEEFARAAALYRPLSQTMAARFTTAKDTDDNVDDNDVGMKERSSAAKMKMFGALTRERFQWHPDKILCKRFNIPNPYPGSGVTGVVRDRREKVDIDESMSRQIKAIEYKPHSGTEDETKDTAQQAEAKMTPKPSALVAGFQGMASQRKQLSNQDGFFSASSSGEVDKERDTTENDENVIKRASMDLFNEIFAESSSESDSESEENEKSEQSENVPDMKDLVQENDEGSEKIDPLPTGAATMSVQEKTKPVEAVEREPSPETFGPALPSSVRGAYSRFSKEFQSSIRDESPSRREKLKHRKKKKRKTKKGKESDTYTTDSNDGFHKQKKEKKKKYSKKDSELYDGNESSRRKKSKKKTRANDTDDESSDSENEGYNRYKKKKSKNTDSEQTDSDEKYNKQKKSKKRKRKNVLSDVSSEDEYNKYRNYKRRGKEKREKETNKHKLSKTKKGYNEYESEEYVEKVAENIKGESSSRTDSKEGRSYGGVSHRKDDYEKERNYREEISKEDRERWVSVDKTKDTFSLGETNEPRITRVPDKEIINKLKNIQMLKERKRMRAADFM